MTSREEISSSALLLSENPRQQEDRSRGASRTTLRESSRVPIAGRFQLSGANGI
jgi:hypothetical protein